jgi:hypothetical protein
MTNNPNRRRGRSGLAALILGASLLAVGSGATIAAEPTGSVRAPAPNTAMVLQNVTLTDLVANKHNICDGSFTHIMKNSAGSTSNLKFLDAAARCGVKVIFHFPRTVSGGTVYPSRVVGEVWPVRAHPALWGYLTVKEPSWVGINAREIRSLYTAFKTADRYHPVMALFGDIPHFGQAANPYTAGMADLVMIDWYPVETANGGASRSGTSYIGTGPTWFTKVRKVVRARTLGTPIWLMVQTHKYLAPARHKKQRPTETLLRRQVRDGLTSLFPSGYAFHTWANTSYQSDQLRDPTMVTWMKRISNQVRAGTFN